MKLLFIVALIALNLVAPAPNKTVDKVDYERYAGKWYSLSSIPTLFDKDTRETTTTYTLTKDGYYNVLTVAKKGDDKELKTYKSKLFPATEAHNGEMKAQFLWPFKVDYWIVDLAPDYSYVIVGHPDHEFLFIMSRKPIMDKVLFDELVAKCKAMGYPVEKLVSQKHHD